MDIKLVKNFEEGMYIPVNREILLQIIDDNRRLEQFNGKHIFLFNPANNERFEILPEVLRAFAARVPHLKFFLKCQSSMLRRFITARRKEIILYLHQQK